MCRQPHTSRWILPHRPPSFGHFPSFSSTAICFLLSLVLTCWTAESLLLWPQPTQSEYVLSVWHMAVNINLHKHTGASTCLFAHECWPVHVYRQTQAPSQFVCRGETTLANYAFTLSLFLSRCCSHSLNLTASSKCCWGCSRYLILLNHLPIMLALSNSAKSLPHTHGKRLRGTDIRHYLSGYHFVISMQ